MKKIFLICIVAIVVAGIGLMGVLGWIVMSDLLDTQQTLAELSEAEPVVSAMQPPAQPESATDELTLVDGTRIGDYLETYISQMQAVMPAFGCIEEQFIMADDNNYLLSDNSWITETDRCFTILRTGASVLENIVAPDIPGFLILQNLEAEIHSMGSELNALIDDWAYGIANMDADALNKANDHIQEFMRYDERAVNMVSEIYELVTGESADAFRAPTQPESAPDELTLDDVTRVWNYMDAIDPQLSAMGIASGGVANQFFIARENTSLVFDDSWIVETAGYFATIKATASMLEKMDAPNILGYPILQNLEAEIFCVSREMSAGVDEWAYGLDNVDGDALSQGGDHVQAATRCKERALDLMGELTEIVTGESVGVVRPPAQPEDPRVWAVYRISNASTDENGFPATYVNLTYENNTGGTNQSEELIGDGRCYTRSDGSSGCVPSWTEGYPVEAGDFLYISAQESEGYGLLTCEILLTDAKGADCLVFEDRACSEVTEWKRASCSGDYCICSVSGMVGYD